MKKKFEFSLATSYSNSKVKDIVELEFDDDATEEEIESQVNEMYGEWLSDENYGGWHETEGE